MIALEKIRRSPADFLIDEAVMHFGKTGNSVYGFIVPTAMWWEIKADPEAIQTENAGILDIEGFRVMASNRFPPTLIEDDNTKGVPLL